MRLNISRDEAFDALQKLNDFIDHLSFSGALVEDEEDEIEDITQTLYNYILHSQEITK